MSRARTASARLERLLHVLPAAMRPGGASLAELAAAFDTTEQRILEDIEEMTARVFYQPGGWPDDVQIFIEGGRVRVAHASGFERPVRLTVAETLCLALALRGTAAAARVPADERRAALLARAEAHLGCSLDVDGTAPGLHFDSPERAPDPEGIREVLLTGARDRRPCAIAYVKAGASDASARVVHPYAVACAEGAWYVIAHCAVEKGVRVFRVDRILAADLADGSFEAPADFDPGLFVQDGRVYHADLEREVRVRYSSRIARWIRERGGWTESGVGADRGVEDGSVLEGGVEEGPDGAVVVRHRVADPAWAVAHTLQYGADAEVLEPDDVRSLVRQTAERLAG